MMAWLIEDRVFPRAEEVALQSALRELGIDFRVASNADLRNSNVSPTRFDVARGSCWWISRLANQPDWPTELWGANADFAFSNYARRFGQLLLNDRYKVLSFDELCWRGIEKAGNTASLFVRPDVGFKSFEGQVVHSNSFDEWVDRMRLLQVRGSLPVVTAPAQEIRAEWRLVIVDGIVTSGSQYRPSQVAEVPAHVKAFAELAHRTAGPECWCYVMDIAECATGLKVIELGSMNCVAFYASNPTDIIRAVSSLSRTIHRS